MGNATDRQTEIYSCTIVDMRKIEPLRGTISRINPERNNEYIWANRITVLMIHKERVNAYTLLTFSRQNIVSVVFVAYQHVAVYCKRKRLKKGKSCETEI